MSGDEQQITHGCGDACSCAAAAAPRALDWSDMLAYSCRHLGKFAVYGNYTARADEHDDTLTKLCARFFDWCKGFGIDKQEQGRILQDLLCGNAVLFDSSEEAGRIYRFFLEKGLHASAWFACLVSPTEGIVDENT